MKQSVKKDFVIIGAGYVGLSLSVLLARKYKIGVIDTNPQRVDQINDGISYLDEQELIDDLEKFKNNIDASTSYDSFAEPEYVIVCTPTDYDPDKQFFDTSSVKSTIEISLQTFPNSYIVIKSTVPVGFTTRMEEKFESNKIIFSPEFLREGSALKDNLNPSRIIVSDNTDGSKNFLAVMNEFSKNADAAVILAPPTEAEAIKLFSNTYLALRISFFNELDSYALKKNLSTKDIIEGVCSDPRIGNGYNNPSFGYGGYCLPKDTKQLLSNYQDIPQSTISAIVHSNTKRKDYIAAEIIDKNPKTVGIYRLIMKEGSDNIRQSAIQGIIKRLRSKNINMIIYEPKYNKEEFFGSKIYNNLEKFFEDCDLIVANRFSDDLKDYKGKIFTRDLFGVN